MTAKSYPRFFESYLPEDRIAFFLRDRQRNLSQQQTLTVAQARTNGFHSRLIAANQNGADIYVSMNPLRPQTFGRTKADIQSIRHLFLDIDQNGDYALERILDDHRLPSPHMIINTSPHKWQVIWRVVNFHAELAEGTHRTLVTEFGADKATIDISRVLRVPTFYNHKYTPPFLVTLLRNEGSSYSPSDFISFPPRAETEHSVASTPKHQNNRKSTTGITQSERDWAWTLEELKQGKSPQLLVQELATRRKDKPSPLYYARHTVTRAEMEIANRAARKHY